MSLRRFAPVLLIACVWAARAAALPQELIDRGVEMRAQIEENILVSFRKEIDYDTMMSRNAALNAELLWVDAQIQALPSNIRREVEYQIKSETKVRYALLQRDYAAGKLHDREYLQRTASDLAAAQQAVATALRRRTILGLALFLTIPLGFTALYLRDRRRQKKTSGIARSRPVMIA